jgi:peroxiredoxin
LQSRLSDIRSLDAEVLAISVDSPADSREIVRAYGLEFPLLSDADGAVLDAFGVRHAGGGLAGDIARPALFILDREGRVVWRELTDNWRVRVRPETILERLAAIP